MYVSDFKGNKGIEQSMGFQTTGFTQNIQQLYHRWWCTRCYCSSLLYRLIMRTQDMKTHLHAYSVRFTFCHCDLLQTYEKKSFSVFPVENKDKISF